LGVRDLISDDIAIELQMRKEQIALQCYTIREHAQTAAALARSLARVREIGYRTLQISGVGPIPAPEIRRIADAEGLAICATHEPGKTIVESPSEVVERLSILGCRHTAYPYPHLPLDSPDAVLGLAEGLNRAGAVLAAAGMSLSYHNHALEFQRVGDKTILELLLERTDPELVRAEIDTYWVQAGGGDPAEWCRRLPGRLPLLHLKDYAVVGNEPTMAALGEGNLDFPKIVAAAARSGCEWFIVEQDRGFSDPFVAIATSLRYLERLEGEGSS
jgi:sugar phosphate isomerase/epimerase